MWPFKSKKKTAVKSMIAPVIKPIVAEIKKWVITQELLSILEQKKPSAEIVPYVPPKGVIPESKRKAAMAMDETPYNYVNATYVGVSFKGYPYLALLSQQPEFRKISEDIAQHMVRKWIKVESRGDNDKTDRIAEMEDALKSFNVRDIFKCAAEMDGFYGRGQVYIEVKTPSGVLASEDEAELKLPLILDKAKIKKGSLVRFQLVEPVWTYPNQYNSSNPLDKDWYKPSQWYVMGKDVHDTRLLLFISRPLPDLLKASYNFGGLSLSQLAEPYVNNFLRTRDSVSDIIHSYSVSGIKTDLEALLQPGMAQEMENRARLYNAMRDNRGLFIMDKEREEFFQFNTPLNGLDSLQAQSQEMMATVAKEPLIYMFGTTPSGLNATSEGEIKVWHEYVTAMQNVLFRANLTKVLQVIGLHLWGEIDDDITFGFVSLDEMSPKEKADIEKVKADTDAVSIANGVIAPDEARQRIANDPESDYQGLEVNREIAEPDDEADSEETAKDYALDASDIPEGSRWITLEDGQHVLIGKTGQVISGAGGNLNGKYYTNHGTGPQKEKQNQQSTEKNQESEKKSTQEQNNGVHSNPSQGNSAEAKTEGNTMNITEQNIKEAKELAVNLMEKAKEGKGTFKDAYEAKRKENSIRAQFEIGRKKAKGIFNAEKNPGKILELAGFSEWLGSNGEKRFYLPDARKGYATVSFDANGKSDIKFFSDEKAKKDKEKHISEMKDEYAKALNSEKLI